MRHINSTLEPAPFLGPSRPGPTFLRPFAARHVLDLADYMTPTPQNELDHTDHTTYRSYRSGIYMPGLADLDRELWGIGDMWYVLRSMISCVPGTSTYQFMVPVNTCWHIHISFTYLYVYIRSCFVRLVLLYVRVLVVLLYCTELRSSVMYFFFLFKKIRLRRAGVDTW